MVNQAAQPGKAGSLILENVSKRFPQREGSGEIAAVDEVTLTIQQGEFVTLLGPSGCGKTTTLRLIAGFESPTAGRIMLDGKDITNQPPNNRDMAMVFQSYALFPHMSVYENVAYGLHIRKLPRTQLDEKVKGALGMMGLAELGKRRPNQLSGGQQQRVALARALVMEPRILLFDEPLSNLDAKLRVQMRSEIHNLQRRLSITSVYVTHDQVEAMALSDRIVVMNAGKIEQIGSPEDIYRYPETRFVADFIGQANFIETQVEAVSQEDITATILGRRVTIPTRRAYQTGQTALVMLRPEALKLRADSSLHPVTVEQTMYLGTEVEYVVRVDGQTLVATENDPRVSQIFREGQAAGIDFVSEAIHLLPA